MKTNQTNIAFDTKGLKDLVASFIQDPFTQSQGLQKLSLEEIGKYFEEPTEELNQESFDRIKSLYCLILLELELLSYSSVPEESLQELFVQLGGEMEQAITMDPNPTLTEIPLADIALDDFVLPGGGKLETTATKETSFSSISKMLDSDSSRAYFEMSRAFTSPGSFPRSIKTADTERLHAQCLIWTVECELLKRLKPTLANFWPQRDSHIARVIFQNGHAYDFHPALKEGFEQLAKNHSDWFYEHKFPVAGIMASLRYVLSVPTSERFVPACIDFAALLMLFGRNTEYGAQILYNVLNIQGITQDEILEMSARLSRIQRLKAKILNPHLNLTPETLDTVRKDVDALLPLLLRMEAKPRVAASRQVA